MKTPPLMAAPSQFTIRHATYKDENTELAQLLDQAFPDVFEGRCFFKQRPHQRLLAFENDRLVGQIGIDLRAITVGGTLLNTIGFIDLCVTPQSQGQKLGSALLQAAEQLTDGQDFAILFTDDASDFYKYHGYSGVTPALTRWFAIDELRSHSVIERDLSDCLMVKPLRNQNWPKGRIDLLGYLF